MMIFRAASADIRHEVRHSTVVPRHRLESVNDVVLQCLLPSLLLKEVYARRPPSVGSQHFVNKVSMQYNTIHHSVIHHNTVHQKTILSTSIDNTSQDNTSQDNNIYTCNIFPVQHAIKYTIATPLYSRNCWTITIISSCLLLLSSFSSVHISNNCIQKNFEPEPERAKELPIDNMWTNCEFVDYLK